MTSDLENDEIKDSAFPVEFKDDSISLDMYGVWVKKGPRDAPETPQNRVNPNPKPDQFDAFETLPELADFGDLPDLKDETQAEFITFEEIVPEKTNTPEISSDSEQFVETSPRTDTDFSTLDVDDFLNSADTSTTTVVETRETNDHTGFTDQVIVSEIAVDDSIPDSQNVAIEKIEEKPIIDESFDQVDISEIRYEIPEDIDFSPEEFEIDEATDVTVNSIKSETDEFSDIAGKDLPSDDDFSSFLDDLNTGAISDSSISPQLHANSTDSDSIDLDSFIDSFNETGGASPDESKKIFDDLEPVDLVLEFDESFIEDAEKIRATGSSVSESEFFNSEFGVEMIDETVETATAGEFDSLMDSIPEMNQSVMDMPSTESTNTLRSSIIESNEFDDLLLSLDVAPSPAQAKSGQTSTVPKKNIYTLSVTEEDGFEALQPAITESASNDDVAVSLFSTNSEEKKVEIKEQKNEESVVIPASEKKTENEIGLELIENESAFREEILDIPEVWDYNDTESSHETENTVTTFMEDRVALDFDDISAVEQELSDMTPDTGDDAVVTNDKSTELLMIIADELTSIKNEITTLKTELSAFKNAGLKAEPIINEETEIITDNSGFFSDDDTDETIALTGDELNNILITADFTEEKNEELIDNTDEQTVADIQNMETDSQTGDDFSISDTIASASFENEEEKLSETIVDFVPAAISPDILADEHDIPETLPDSIFDIGELN